LRVNPAAVAHYGYSADEFMRMHIPDLQPPGEGIPQERPFSRLLAGQEKNGTFRHRRKDGVVIFVELISLPLKYQGQACQVVMAHDITKYLMLDRENSDLMADAAHEMRTPLTAIMGFADLLTTQKKLPPETQQQFLARIYTSGQKLKVLLDQILNRAQPEPKAEPVIHRERFRAGAMIKAVLAVFTHATPEIQFTLEESPQEIFLYIDKTKITQVLFTLIGSVAKHTPREPIRISWGLVEGDFVVSIHNPVGRAALGGELEMTLSEWIATAHGGQIWSEESIEGGAIKLAIPTGFEERRNGEAALKDEQED